MNEVKEKHDFLRHTLNTLGLLMGKKGRNNKLDPPFKLKPPRNTIDASLIRFTKIHFHSEHYTTTNKLIKVYKTWRTLYLLRAVIRIRYLIT